MLSMFFARPLSRGACKLPKSCSTGSVVVTPVARGQFVVCVPGKGDNKLGKLLERVRADALAGKDTDVWCSMRFQLPGPLDVAVDLAVMKAGQVVAEPSFEGKPVIKMGEVFARQVVVEIRVFVWCRVVFRGWDLCVRFGFAFGL